mmetsp:Transcript_53677/g.122447  ORF Transcript_53677/g.122447 Transcript_53677/m.122447 type:complete len:200 (-) Transcript_53677:169-768(-)
MSSSSPCSVAQVQAWWRWAMTRRSVSFSRRLASRRATRCRAALRHCSTIWMRSFRVKRRRAAVVLRRSSTSSRMLVKNLGPSRQKFMCRAPHSRKSSRSMCGSSRSAKSCRCSGSSSPHPSCRSRGSLGKSLKATARSLASRARCSRASSEVFSRCLRPRFRRALSSSRRAALTRSRSAVTTRQNWLARTRTTLVSMVQ